MPKATSTSQARIAKKNVRPGPKGNFRRNTPGKNRLETAFSEYLHKLWLAGEILDYKYESAKLRLARNTFYTPDFLAVYPDEFHIYEVKGHWEEDARQKIKWAAQLYWYFRFFGVQREKKSGEWLFEEFF